MIAQSFDYESPGTLKEALTLLEKHGEEAKILSGGMAGNPRCIISTRFAACRLT